MPEMFRKSRAFVPRYQKFESTSLQRGVCLCTALQGFRRRAPHFCGGLRIHGDERRDGWLHTRPFWPFFSDGRWGSPTLKASSVPRTHAGHGEQQRAIRHPAVEQAALLEVLNEER